MKQSLKENCTGCVALTHEDLPNGWKDYKCFLEHKIEVGKNGKGKIIFKPLEECFKPESRKDIEFIWTTKRLRALEVGT